MHFPSVTRAPLEEGSDSVLARLKKEMEEFHLAVGPDIGGGGRCGEGQTSAQHRDGLHSLRRVGNYGQSYSKLVWWSHVNITQSNTRMGLQ